MIEREGFLKVFGQGEMHVEEKKVDRGPFRCGPGWGA